MATSPKALSALVFTISTWGLSPVLVRKLALASGPADSLVIRLWSVALVCLPLLLVTGFRIESRDLPRLLFVSLVGLFGYFLGSIFGYAHLPAGVGGMLIGTQPLIIAIISASLGMEKLNPATNIGLLVSFFSTLLLFGGDISNKINANEFAFGAGMIIACCLCWGGYVVLAKPLIQKYGAAKITVLSLLLCALPSLVFASGSTVLAITALKTSDFAALFFLSIIATLLSTTLWNFAVAQMPPSLVGASLYLIPVLAVAAGWLILGEAISTRAIFAGFVIMLGVAIAEFGKSFLKNAKSQ